MLTTYTKASTATPTIMSKWISRCYSLATLTHKTAHHRGKGWELRGDLGSWAGWAGSTCISEWDPRYAGRGARGWHQRQRSEDAGIPALNPDLSDYMQDTFKVFYIYYFL